MAERPVRCPSCATTIDAADIATHAVCPACGIDIEILNARVAAARAADDFTAADSSLHAIASATTATFTKPRAVTPQHRRRRAIHFLAFFVVPLLTVFTAALLYFRTTKEHENPNSPDTSTVRVASPQTPDAAIPVPAAGRVDTERALTQRMRDLDRRRATTIQDHRRRIESLCDRLLDATLWEPDTGRAYDAAKNLQGSLLDSVDSTGAAPTTEINYSIPNFQRSECRALLTNLSSEAATQGATLDKISAERGALELQRPSRALRDAWAELSTASDHHGKSAQELLAGDLGTRFLSRAEVAAFIAELGKPTGNYATRLTAELKELQTLLDQLKKYAADPDAQSLVPEATAAAAARQRELSEVASKLGDAAKPVTPAVAGYHARLLAGLPERLENPRAIMLVDSQIRAQTSSEPAMWQSVAIRFAYQRWMSDSFASYRRTGDGLRMTELMEAHKAALESPAADERWRVCVTAFSAGEADDAKRVVSERLSGMTDSGVAAALLAFDDTALERAQQGPAATTQPADLPYASPVLHARRVAGNDAAVREYHATLMRRHFTGANLASLAHLLEAVATARRDAPQFWEGAVPARYGQLFTFEWDAFCRTHLGKDVLDCHRAYALRDATAETRSAFAASANRLRLTSAQLDGVMRNLDAARLAREVFGEAGALGIGERHLGQISLGAPSAAAANGPVAVITGRGDERFWEDVAWARDQTERKTLLGAVNPYEATRALGLPPATRWHHVELMRKLNANRTLDDLVAMKEVLVEDRRTNPGMWPASATLSTYAPLQAAQWQGWVIRTLARHSGALGAFRMRGRGDAREWRRAATPLRPFAPAMLKLLDAPLEQSAIENAARGLYGKLPPAGNSGQWSDLATVAFWTAVRDGK